MDSLWYEPGSNSAADEEAAERTLQFNVSIRISIQSIREIVHCNLLNTKTLEKVRNTINNVSKVTLFYKLY